MDRFFCIYRRIVRLFALLCLLFVLIYSIASFFGTYDLQTFLEQLFTGGSENCPEALFHRKGEDTPELFVPFPDESDIFLKKAGQNREKPLEISLKIVYNL